MMYRHEIEPLFGILELGMTIRNELKPSTREIRRIQYENTKRNYSPNDRYPAIQSQFMRR